MSSKIGSYQAISLAIAASLAGALAARAAEPLTEVMVEAPRVVHSSERTGALQAPVDVASIRYRVSYADLNLATASGARALEQRINDAASRACAELERATSPHSTVVPGDPPCVKTATDGAMKQANAAIAAAEQAARK